VNNGRYTGHTEACYGKQHFQDFADRPILCCGTIIGNRRGMHRMLSVLVSEFLANNVKPNEKCRSPHTTDQWTMNYLYYTGQFGEYNSTTTVPWGTGPVNTIGTACVNMPMKDTDKKHSQIDLTGFEDDYIDTDVNRTNSNLILNLHEPPGSPARIAPIVHQYDRCKKWIGPWFAQHPELSQSRPDGNYIPISELPLLPWKTSM
jgi:hypothetical protein